MAAKERHKQKVKQRIHERLDSMLAQEQALHSLIRDYVEQAESKAEELLGAEDTVYFMQQYGNVEQLLDRVNNMCELLSTTAEDMIENSEMDVTVKPNASLSMTSNVINMTRSTEIMSANMEESKATKNCSVASQKGEVQIPDKKDALNKDPTVNFESQANKEENNATKTCSVDIPIARILDKKDDLIKDQTKSQGNVVELPPPEKTGLIDTVGNKALLKKDEDITIFKALPDSSKPYSHDSKEKKDIKESKVSTNTQNSTSSKNAKKATMLPEQCAKKKTIKKSHSGANPNAVRMVIPGPVKQMLATYINQDNEDTHNNNDNNVVGPDGLTFAEEDQSVNFERNTSTPVANSDVSLDLVLDPIKPINNRKKFNIEGDVPKKYQSKTSDSSHGFSESDFNENISNRVSSKTKISEIHDVDDSTVKRNSAHQSVREVTFKKLVIEQASLPSGNMCSVIVSDIVSPWCFCVQWNAPDVSLLMEQICTYMSHGGLHEEPLHDPQKGEMCLAKFSRDKAFYRAYILLCLDSTKEVEVLYVDYGNRERVKIAHIRKLPERFQVPPMQAICCSLAEVMPNNKYMLWTDEEVMVFKQYVMNQQFNCEQACKCTSPGVPVIVRLIGNYQLPSIPSGQVIMNQFSIGEILVNRGSAKYVNPVDQIGLVEKSGEGKEESLTLNKGTAQGQVIEIHEQLEHVKEDEHKEQQTEICVNSVPDRTISHLQEPDETLDESGKPRSTGLNKNKKVEECSPKIGVKRSFSSEDVIGKDTSSDHNVEDKMAVERNSEIHDADNETVSSAYTTDMDSERSTDTGFQSTEVTFDLQLNPQGEKVMLAHVQSPSHFYVHVLQVGYTLDLLMKSLNKHYEKMNRRKLTRLSQTFVPVVQKFCCAQFMQDNSFYRAVILNIRSDKEIGMGKVHVHYIDFGDDEWIPKRRLFPLPPHYSSVPPLAIKCKLAYIKPADTTGSAHTAVDGVYKWSDGSTKVFLDMMGLEKALNMQVVEGHLTSNCKGELVGESDEILGVLLEDTTGMEEVCANTELIRLNHAVLDVSTKGNINEITGLKVAVSEDVEKMQDWNPMEADFLSKRNTYKVDIEDAEMATQGYKSQDRQGVCRYFSKGAHCWRGESCPYRHVQSDSVVPLEREEVYCLNNQADALPDVNSWVAVEVTTILTPGRFYIMLPLGNKSLDGTSNDENENANTHCTESLDDLLTALNIEYNKKSPNDRSLKLKAPGEIVVAKFSQDNQWYRARVIRVTEDKVKVFYLDFGNTEWLPEKEIIEITPEFLHLPFQALECFLCNVEPVGDESWTKESKNAFRNLVDGKTLVAHIRSRSWNGCLSVDLYDTSEEHDVNIAEKLIENNHAIPASFLTDSSCNGSASGQSQKSNSTSSEVRFVPG